MSRHSEGAPFEPLTKRELQVLALVADGLSNGEIAKRLVFAPTTVKWYIRQVFNKLGVEKRAEAIERAAALGLVQGGKPVAPVRHNLPAPVTPFIGRERELADLSQLLHDKRARHVTILAPGGMGKTRLALAAAGMVVEARAFSDGVYFVPLAPLTSPESIVPAAADAVDFQFTSDSRTPLRQLLDFLRNKHLLLVLDNFEHLLDGAPLVTEILQSAPDVAALVTSRERLNLTGESVYTLSGMAYPEHAGADDFASYGAVQLFVQCARRTRADFAPDAGADGVVRVCQLAQGMPLALELAAAWVGGLSPAEIAEEITHSLDFLQTRMRDMPERLRSVRAVFESAWARLAEQEQAVFRRLSVFRGGCTREAAQAVTGADVATLAALADRALLRRHPNGRYEVHELLRQYAAEQLERSGEAQPVHHAHAGYFAGFASEQSETLRGAQQREALSRIEADLDNIRQGFGRAGETADTGLIEQFADTWLFFDMRAGWQEGRLIFEQALHPFGQEENRAVGKLLMGQGLFLHRLCLFNEALEAAENSVRVLRQHGQPRDTLLPLGLLGISLDALEQYDRSHDIYEELYPLAQRYGDAWEKTTSLFLLGADALQHKDFDRARDLFERSYRDYQQVGNSWGAAFPLNNLAHLAYHGKDYERAEQLFNEQLILAEECRFPFMIASSFDGLSMVARARGDLGEAIDLLEKCLIIWRDVGTSQPYLEVDLGRIVCEKHGYDMARPYFRKAFERFKELQSVTGYLYLNLIIAESMAQTGENERAVELISLFFHQPGHETVLFFEPDRPDNLVARLRNELSPEQFTAAWQRGEAASIETLLEKMLYSEP